jgi:hypothetical protein
MIDLKQLADRKYKIALDESYEAEQGGKLWYYQIPCRNGGHIYVHGEDRLGVYVPGSYQVSKIREIPGIRIHQTGDKEATFTFPPELLDAVATAMKARKARPEMSEEAKAAAIARIAPFRFPESRG